MSSIYYSPEEYGLTVVKDVEWRDESFEFCMTVLWRDAAGKFYAASDSGCSCPSPFEDYRSVADLTPIESLGDLLAVCKQASEEHYFDWDNTQGLRADLVSAYQTARSAA